LRASAVAARLRDGLDEWLGIAPPGAERQVLADLLREVDPDPGRTAVRAALVSGDDKALQKAVRALDPAAVPPRFAAVVGGLKSLPVADRLRALEGAWRLRPGDFPLLLRLGTCHHRLPGGAKAAAGYYRAALAARPDSAAAWNNLGLVLQEENDLVGATAAFRKALEVAPGYPRCLLNLGVVLTMRKDHAGALDAFRRCVAAQPGYFLAWYNLGTVLQSQKDHKAAVSAFRKAIEASPGSVPAHVNLAAALYDLGNQPAADTVLQRALTLDPRSEQAWANLGLVRQRQNDLAGAVVAFRKALEIKERSARTHCDLGHTQLGRGDFAGALTAFRRAVEIDPALDVAHHGVGKALAVQGDLEGARAALGRAVALGPNNVGALLHLGQVSLDLGRLHEALSAFVYAERACPAHHPLRQPIQVDLPRARYLARLSDRLDEVRSGKAVPSGPDERFALALLCLTHRRLPRTALRLCEEGLRELPNPSGKRVGAARAAARTAAGDGLDCAGLGDAERAELRRRALDWLRADLADWEKAVAGKDNRAAAQALRGWRTVRDLATVRDEPALARLPEPERAAWRRFWADVAAVARKVEGK
jgi:tetratricopeptide (TPR) repeat protein